jgi:tRNA nucleotidyltransferase (CCA-adding enzyme)
MEKLLLLAQRPSIGLGWLHALAVIDQLFPEIKALIEVPQDPEWHPEGDVFVHTRLVVDRARELIDDLSYPKQVTVMLAALAHDFGKPATTDFIDGRLRSRGHEEAGVAPTNSFLDRLNIHTLDGYDVRAQVVALVRDHLKPGEYFKKRADVGDGAFRRLARKCELDLLYRVAKADSLGRNADWVPQEQWYGSEAQEWFIERARELEVVSHAPAPLLLGRHLLELGLTPGPRIGEITRAVYEMQLDGRVLTLDDAKEVAKEVISTDTQITQIEKTKS